MHSRQVVPPHLQKRLCRKCRRRQAKMLVNGQIVLNPTCDVCRAEDERVFRLAQLAANRQSRNHAHRRRKR